MIKAFVVDLLNLDCRRGGRKAHMPKDTAEGPPFLSTITSFSEQDFK